MLPEFDRLTDAERLAMTTAAFGAFADSLGPNDIYKQILLEEVFRVLMGEGNDDERLPVHGEA